MDGTPYSISLSIRMSNSPKVYAAAIPVFQKLQAMIVDVKAFEAFYDDIKIFFINLKNIQLKL